MTVIVPAPRPGVNPDVLVTRMENEVRPLIPVSKNEGGYDCCGCSTYDAVLDHAIRIVQEEAS